MLSCIQPTGDAHLGSYLGALRPWVEGQHAKDAFHGVELRLEVEHLEQRREHHCGCARLHQPVQTVEVVTPDRPDSAVVDPEGVLIDMDPSNNRRPL